MWRVVTGEGGLVDVKSETPTNQSHSFGSEMRSYSHKNGAGATRICGSICLTLIQTFCRLCFELTVISLMDGARDRSGTLRGDVSPALSWVQFRAYFGEVDRGNECPMHGR